MAKAALTSHFSACGLNSHRHYATREPG